MSVDIADLHKPAEVIEREPLESIQRFKFLSNRKSLYWTFWLLVPLILPTCAFLYALPLTPVILLSAKVAGTSTDNHWETLGVIIGLTSLALALVTVGTLWQRTRAIARAM